QEVRGEPVAGGDEPEHLLGPGVDDPAAGAVHPALGEFGGRVLLGEAGGDELAHFSLGEWRALRIADAGPVDRGAVEVGEAVEVRAVAGHGRGHEVDGTGHRHMVPRPDQNGGSASQRVRRSTSSGWSSTAWSTGSSSRRTRSISPPRSISAIAPRPWDSAHDSVMAAAMRGVARSGRGATFTVA